MRKGALFQKLGRASLAALLAASMVPGIAWAQTDDAQTASTFANNESVNSNSANGTSDNTTNVSSTNSTADNTNSPDLNDGSSNNSSTNNTSTNNTSTGNTSNNASNSTPSNEALNTSSNASSSIDSEPLEDVSNTSQTESPEAKLAATSIPDPVTVTLSSDEKTATVELDKAVAPNASSVTFPTWSLAGGQNDLVWYAATKNTDGSWQANIPISRHKTAGTYAVHVYATVGGAQQLVATTSFEVKAPKAQVAIKAQSADQKKVGSFTVEIGLSDVPSGATRVQVPVWSSANGQDDIEWLDASKTGANTWQVEVSLAHPRRDVGEYIAHVYVTCGNGIFAYAGSTSATVSIDPASITTQVSPDQKTVTISGMGGWFAQATSVAFPTWSLSGGQDDIRWYNATKYNGAWTLTVPVSNHKSSGTYAVHAYGVVNGNQRFVAASSFVIDQPKMNVAISQSEAQKGGGTFTVTVQTPADYKASNPTRVQVPVWSSANSQDDIEWLDASKTGANTWQVEVSLAHPRRDVGEYIAHVYVTCENGVFAFGGQTSSSVVLAPENVDVSLTNDQMSATVKLSGGKFALATAVSVPTWSLAGGQDDIVWYNAKKTNGEWTATIPITSHRSSGKYALHFYSTIAGTQKFSGASEFTIDAPSCGAVAVDKDDSAGTITVNISGIDSKSGILRVQVPTWTSAGGQDDIVWHDAQNAGNNTFRVTIPAGQHNCEAGAYICHVYVTGKNGVVGLVGTGQVSLTLTNYVYVSGSGSSRMVWVRNPSVSASGIQVPTWSATGGQDDIIWYEAQNMGGGLWRANINCCRLRHSGTCYSHIYSGSSCIGATSFSVSENDVNPIVQYHNIGWVGQPNGYYCGPTSGYTILQYLGATRSARGDALTIENVARYMNTNSSGISMQSRDFERGMNNWLGYNAYTTIEHPSYETVRDEILNSFKSGYPVAIHTWESRGGSHYNGHGNSTMGHVMVVDGYDRNTDSVLIVDPWAGVWSSSSQKFWYGSLRDFVNRYVAPMRGIYVHH